MVRHKQPIPIFKLISVHRAVNTCWLFPSLLSLMFPWTLVLFFSYWNEQIFSFWHCQMTSNILVAWVYATCCNLIAKKTTPDGTLKRLLHGIGNQLIHILMSCRHKVMLLIVKLILLIKIIFPCTFCWYKGNCDRGILCKVRSKSNLCLMCDIAWFLSWFNLWNEEGHASLISSGDIGI